MTSKKISFVCIRKIICMVAVLLLAVSMTSCGTKKLAGSHWEIASFGEMSNDLIGTLKNSRYYLYFTSDSEGYFQGKSDETHIDAFTYTIEDGTVSINFNTWPDESGPLDMDKPIKLLIEDRNTLLSSMGFNNTIVTFKPAAKTDKP